MGAPALPPARRPAARRQQRARRARPRRARPGAARTRPAHSAGAPARQPSRSGPAGRSRARPLLRHACRPPPPARPAQEPRSPRRSPASARRGARAGRPRSRQRQRRDGAHAELGAQALRLAVQQDGRAQRACQRRQRPRVLPARLRVHQRSVPGLPPLMQPPGWTRASAARRPAALRGWRGARLQDVHVQQQLLPAALVGRARQLLRGQAACQLQQLVAAEAARAVACAAVADQGRGALRCDRRAERHSRAAARLRCLRRVPWRVPAGRGW
jgi:hypothetical protein